MRWKDIDIWDDVVQLLGMSAVFGSKEQSGAQPGAKVCKFVMLYPFSP